MRANDVHTRYMTLSKPSGVHDGGSREIVVGEGARAKPGEKTDRSLLAFFWGAFHRSERRRVREGQVVARSTKRWSRRRHPPAVRGLASRPVGSIGN